MKTITKHFNLYPFPELSGQAQARAISDHIDFEIQVMDEDSPFWDSCLEAERMQTPWFLGEIIHDNHKDDVIDTILANEYLFFQDGELIPLDYYPA